MATKSHQAAQSGREVTAVLTDGVRFEKSPEHERCRTVIHRLVGEWLIGR